MNFEIPFDSKISAKQYALSVELVFKKNFTKSVKNTIGAGIIIFFGWLMMDNKSSIGYIFVSMGLFYLVNALNYFWYYNKTSKKLNAIYRDMIGRKEKNKDVFIIGEVELGEPEFARIVALVNEKIKNLGYV